MDLSTRLSYLFGTEEYVGMRRQLVLLRETLMNHIDNVREWRHIFCGSLGEGVAYPSSDDDVVFCLTKFRAAKTYREATQPHGLLMVPSEFPGYCLLFDVRGTYPDHFIRIINEMPCVSSSLWKQRFLREGLFIHGPCQSAKTGYHEVDYAVCIPSYNWPDIANDWINRDRPNDWPSSEMIHTIVNNGCHVVAIGNPDSPNYQHEWRISFVVAERTLMHSLNHTQFLVYNLLRLTLKRVIDIIFPEVMCSYFMKTTLFYTAENTPIHLWNVQNLETCFKTCLSLLYDYVDHIYFPNYFIPENNMNKCNFIPENNMIEYKVNHTNRNRLLKIIRYIYSIGIVGIKHLSGESSSLDANLSATQMEYKLDRELMFSSLLYKSLAVIESCIKKLPHAYTECCPSYLYNFWRIIKCNATIIRSKLLGVVWNIGIKSCCLKMMDFIFTTPDMNKQFYHFCKTLEAILTMGYIGDVTTGKLTMATYMYMVGKTESALCVIRQLFLEYQPYVIDASGDELKQQAYKDQMCGRGFSITFKMRHAYASTYCLDRLYLNAFPSSMKIWITITNEVYLDPLTFAYFLESLCYIHHRNQIHLLKALRCLIDHMGAQEVDGATVYTRMCVGIIKYVQGDNQSACRWLGSALAMKDMLPPPMDKRLSCSAVTYIACLLNKNYHSY